jgi:hypothetical protein
MGITVQYRGALRKPEQIEAFEDRIVELAVEMDGMAQIWRSSAEENKPRGRRRRKAREPRVIRGVMLYLAPGLEPISLLVAPEGWLIPLSEIPAAESGALKEPPWASVRTHFGPLEAHVMLVELLDALRKKYVPSLEVRDEGGYWETRDLEQLRRRHGQAEQAAGTPDEALRDEDLIPGAPEDPRLLAQRVGHVAERVRRILARPPEHPPVTMSEDPRDPGNPERFGTEQEWDESHKEQLRRQAGLMRAMEERRLKGDEVGHAFREALREEGIAGLPEPDGSGKDDDWLDLEDKELEENAEDTEETDEARAAEEEERRAHEEHPLMRRMTELTKRVLRLPERKDLLPGSFLDPLIQGVLEMAGATAQIVSVLTQRDAPRGLLIVQLKRALRGAAFARAAIFPARHFGMLSGKNADYFWRMVMETERQLQSELRKTREEP